ncbi:MULTISPECIES: NADPH-dependent FMN reductase [Vitreoscilla]|uniref:NAD(P)H-dependent oxidoreductase n=1 Tax=Vitreoscilla stercoraria TaxID=61 RepID=A0ABY4E948_VITST|nr:MULTISPECIES: NAD(P)H-dependent oxidoreductase [Vitreoscilla]AUZ04428.1 NADPH-dependent FMN reductase [Vitreoscilla sp. C1]UOO91851.1 NAD(P)H-dependent oxidoreductase [Vitreoscilla stercoraria]
MAAYQVGMVVGSLRQDSFNLKLAKALAKLFPSEIEISFVDISQLPLYNQDLDNQPTETVSTFKQAVAALQGVVFVTPEHNRSISAALKNALDHGSRPYGKSVWAGKVAGVIGTSPGAIATAVAQQHLRNIVAALDMPTVNQPEAFVQWTDDLMDAEGVFNKRSAAFLQQWVHAYVALLKQQAA